MTTAYIVHPDSGTFMAADECYYVVTDSEEQVEALHRERLDEAVRLGARKYLVEPGDLEEECDSE
jgi:hypothetical protein